LVFVGGGFWGGRFVLGGGVLGPSGGVVACRGRHGRPVRRPGAGHRYARSSRGRSAVCVLVQTCAARVPSRQLARSLRAVPGRRLPRRTLASHLHGCCDRRGSCRYAAQPVVVEELHAPAEARPAGSALRHTYCGLRGVLVVRRFWASMCRPWHVTVSPERGPALRTSAYTLRPAWDAGRATVLGFYVPAVARDCLAGARPGPPHFGIHAAACVGCWSCDDSAPLRAGCGR
jgi:hypothetical protein